MGYKAREYILPPVAGRAESTGYIIRVLFSRGSGTVTIDGSAYTNRHGKDISISQNNIHTLTCSADCFVYQYNKGYNADSSKWDPFLMRVLPVTQYASKLLWLTPRLPGSYRYRHFVSIIAPTKHIVGVRLDGQEVTGSWAEVSSGFSALRRENINAGAHVVDHRDPAVKLAAYAYGYRTEIAEAYGFSAGSIDQPSWGQWASWSTCSLSCGGGSRVRNRVCNLGSYKSEVCDGSGRENGTCHTRPCPEWSEWSPWGNCSVSCGTGQMVRNRTCIAGSKRVLDCPGQNQDTKCCIMAPCSVPATWEQWSHWGVCTVTCGGGERTRNRQCNPGSPGQKKCSGQKRDTETCNTSPCPAEWGQWSTFGQCSVTCGAGRVVRNRNCTAGTSGKLDCKGRREDTEPCIEKPCPVAATWGEWSCWELCSATCGGGNRIRRRGCIPGSKGQSNCIGLDQEKSSCASSPCKANWGEWTSFGQCSVSCGTGLVVRNRSCTAGTSRILDCNGRSEDTEPCIKKPCPVPATWGQWSCWGSCSATCGGGNRIRRRVCIPGSKGQHACTGSDLETSSCASSPCKAHWTEWSPFESCSVSCGTGQMIRNRTCIAGTANILDCSGQKQDTKCCIMAPCPVLPTWEQWSNWGVCTATCGVGVRERNRHCHHGSDGRNKCSGHERDTETCNASPCPAEWGEWTNFGQCSVTCGTGLVVRNRTCTAGTSGRVDCKGRREDTEPCREMPCPVPATWGQWSCWESCSVTCGEGGYRKRRRVCIPGSKGQRICTGSDQETSSCASSPCPVAGKWEQWSGWGTCRATCGKQRSRSCKSSNEHKRDCYGNSEETKLCDPELCQSAIEPTNTRTSTKKYENVPSTASGATGRTPFSEQECPKCDGQEMKETTISFLYGVLVFLLVALVITWACCFAKMRQMNKPVCLQPVKMKPVHAEKNGIYENETNTGFQQKDLHFETKGDDKAVYYTKPRDLYDNEPHMYELLEK